MPHISTPHEFLQFNPSTYRLIEEQNGWVFQQGACYRKPLLFAAGHHQSTLADSCRVAVWEFHDSFVHLRLLRRCNYLFVTRVQPPISHVMYNVCMEQWGILRDDTNCGTQRRELDPRYVLAIDEYAPSGWFVEAVQETEDR